MQNNSKNINRLISVLWNRKWRIMLGTLIGAAVLWVLSTVVIKPVYTASMSMYMAIKTEARQKKQHLQNQTSQYRRAWQKHME